MKVVSSMNVERNYLSQKSDLKYVPKVTSEPCQKIIIFLLLRCTETLVTYDMISY